MATKKERVSPPAGSAERAERSQLIRPLTDSAACEQRALPHPRQKFTPFFGSAALKAIKRDNSGSVRIPDVRNDSAAKGQRSTEFPDKPHSFRDLANSIARRANRAVKKTAAAAVSLCSDAADAVVSLCGGAAAAVLPLAVRVAGAAGVLVAGGAALGALGFGGLILTGLGVNLLTPVIGPAAPIAGLLAYAAIGWAELNGVFMVLATASKILFEGFG